MGDWRPICELCEMLPQQDDDPLCTVCRAGVEVESVVVCLCNSDETRAVFEGPAIHRRHVAELVYGLLGLPGPAPHEPLLIHEAKEAGDGD